MSLMDADKSGTLSYKEFIDSVAMAGKPDVGAQLMMMQLEMKEISMLLKTSDPSRSMSRSVAVDEAFMQERLRKEQESLRKIAKANGSGTDENHDVSGFPHAASRGL